ncbi:MAG: hypothetical protein MRERV_35c007 [Mycoplasmataceae bacterium RV_VA103A]|nr:MAG: hypothetical protein MRERV_35c007 [Mycoplasmataceae bacterium RV_VA103A]
MLLLFFSISINSFIVSFGISVSFKLIQGLLMSSIPL